MILCVGVDVDSLKRRHQRLREAGYSCDATMLTDASRAMQSADYDMLIIGHKVSDEEARRVSTRFRERSPEGKIVILHEGSRRAVDFADAVITHIDDAENLLETVKLLA